MTLRLLQQSVEGLVENTPVSIRRLKDSSSISTSGPIEIIDCSTEDYVRINLFSDITINLTGATIDGQQIVLAFYQADSIIHNVLAGSSITFGSDVFAFPEITQELDKLDRYIFIYDAIKNKYNLVGYSKGF